MEMRKLTITAFVIAFLACAGWAIAEPGWDSLGAALAALAAALASHFLGREKAPSGQQQHVENGGVGIQAGRDLQVRDVKQGK
ncbi:hypothetical protein ABL849_17495 [Variovorax sp. 375MFSha3.1]|uniref:hypothetical protein n=1 Tax=Variovorax sp. 375MFSha3.1 TaxID=3158364 RepID=UPI003AAA339C